MPGAVGCREVMSTGSPHDAPDELVLDVQGLAKRYGETIALRSCSFSLRRGEVHAIMGENGSGKSTLIKLLSGIVAPDRGFIEVAGQRRAALHTPRLARSLGIGTVFQEILIARNLSVLDNLYLGRDGMVVRRGGPGARRCAARKVMARITERPVDLDAAAGSLTLGQQQLCVIARTLLQRPAVLLLDEPTSALDVQSRLRLFRVLREFCAGGGAVLFISHRLDEVEEIADRVTVLRSGESIATLDRQAARTDAILELMTARRVESGLAARADDSQPGAVVMTIDQVTLRPGGRPISLTVHRSEIIGLAGLEGHGQDEFLAVLAGLRKPRTGSVALTSAVPGPRRRSRPSMEGHGTTAYVPRERGSEGIFRTRSILDNFAIATLGQDRRLGILSTRSARQRLAHYVGLLGVKAPRVSDRITTLSGGTQQKVIMARWLATGPRVLLLNDPTRGVDHGTKQDLYREFVNLAAAGTAIVVLSTELEELVALASRVLIFREGELSQELERAELSPQRLIAGFFGKAGV